MMQTGMTVLNSLICEGGIWMPGLYFTARSARQHKQTNLMLDPVNLIIAGLSADGQSAWEAQNLS